MAPTVLRKGLIGSISSPTTYAKPPHVHIDRDACSAKFCLNPLALAYNLGFPARELRKLESLTSHHRNELLEAWYDYFGT